MPPNPSFVAICVATPAAMAAPAATDVAHWQRPQGAPVVIVDRAGRRAWNALRPELAALVGAEELVVCAGPDPWLLAADVAAACAAGVRCFVCCGGDAAWLAVVHGARGVDGVVVAAGGGPASLARDFGLVQPPAQLGARIVDGTTTPLDTLAVQCDGRAEPVGVANAVWWGWGRRGGWWAGQRNAWGLGTAVAATSMRHERIEVVTGSVRRDVDASAVLVANGQFVGGLSMAPQAHPGDGKLEVLVFEGRAQDVWRMRARLRDGSHLPHPRVRDLRPTSVRLNGHGRLFADGVDIGRLPATITVNPAALQVAI